MSEQDHAQHGRGSALDGPDDVDCPCRGQVGQEACAKDGCGFCLVAQEVADLAAFKRVIAAGAVTFVLRDDEDAEYACEVALNADDDDGVVAVVTSEGVNDAIAEAVDVKELQARYAAALRILEEDVGVSERDLDLVRGNFDPVAVLKRARAGGK